MRTFVRPPGRFGRLATAVRRRLGRGGQITWQPTEETFRNWEDIRALPASALVGVIGVGRSVDAAGITVELLAVEVRALGAILHWRAQSERTELLLSAFISVADQVGTPYRVINGGGEGGAGAWQGQTFVLPALVAGARLSITLERFGPYSDRPLVPGLPTESIAGPWPFDVNMPPAAERR